MTGTDGSYGVLADELHPGTKEVTEGILEAVRFVPLTRRNGDGRRHTAELILETEEQKAALRPEARRVSENIWGDTEGFALAVLKGEPGKRELRHWVGHQVNDVLSHGETRYAMQDRIDEERAQSESRPLPDRGGGHEPGPRNQEHERGGPAR